MEKKMRNRPIIEISSAESVDMADEWYEFASPDHFWIQWRFNSILGIREIRELAGARLFEVGCGNGLVIGQFESMPNIIVDGCDLNLLALNQIENSKGDIYLLNIFENPQELVGKYSGILLLDVIEHIDDDNEFLATSCNYIDDDGLIIINVPAMNVLFSRYDKRAGHKRRYNKKMLKELFKKNDIEIISIRYWGFLLLPAAVIRKFILYFTPERKIIKVGFQPPNQALNWFCKMLMKIENKLFSSPLLGTSLIAVGRRKPTAS
jgi:2-polyprenyl-3-methyl-5-hydroxy-6-metoxy-1,4-benzoquinol methylase